jgi:hypothetical protein
MGVSMKITKRDLRKVIKEMADYTTRQTEPSNYWAKKFPGGDGRGHFAQTSSDVDSYGSIQPYLRVNAGNPAESEAAAIANMDAAIGVKLKHIDAAIARARKLMNDLTIVKAELQSPNRKV